LLIVFLQWTIVVVLMVTARTGFYPDGRRVSAIHVTGMHVVQAAPERNVHE
jgi:hypothetical protein